MARVRLVVERSWLAIAAGLGLLGGGVAMLVVAFARSSYDVQLPGVLVIIGGLLVWRGVHGSEASEQLRVDVPAGMLDFGTSKRPSAPLAALGTLSVATRERRSRNAHRGVESFTEWVLRAEALEEPLFVSYFGAKAVQTRVDALTSAVLQSALRPVLGRPDVDGTAFRSADLGAEVRRIAAGDLAGARLALAALTRDHDATIRRRAREALATVERG
ncbi:MAG: hypothetical protein H0T79_06265 [Deltaproteobacteria bacterium]|nr:hypothetical protein [Deltaproteobacteria bacterium]